MNKSLQALSLAAALAAALPQVAQANMVTLGFENIADLAQVGTTYLQPNGIDFRTLVQGNDVSPGRVFTTTSGRWNFDVDHSKNQGSGVLASCGAPILKQLGGAEVGGCNPYSPGDIEMSLAKGFNNQLEFLYAVGSDPLLVTVYGSDSDGTTWSEQQSFSNNNQNPTCGFDFCNWSTGIINFSAPHANGTGYRVVFSGSTAGFLIDNIKLDANSPTDPGNRVPEPTSLALVALALAGAGAGVRRRRA